MIHKVPREPLSDDLLQLCCEIAARVVAEHGDAYLPIFERMHHEAQARLRKQDIKAVALSFARAKTAVE